MFDHNESSYTGARAWTDETGWVRRDARGDGETEKTAAVVLQWQSLSGCAAAESSSQRIRVNFNALFS